MGKVGQKVQTYCYNINMSWEVTYSMVTIVNSMYCIAYLKGAKREHCKSPHYKKKNWVMMHGNEW